jgi:hypothetical protein
MRQRKDEDDNCPQTRSHSSRTEYQDSLPCCDVNDTMQHRAERAKILDDAESRRKRLMPGADFADAMEGVISVIIERKEIERAHFRR